MNRVGCSASRHGTWQDYQRRGCRCPDAREATRLYRKSVREGTNRVRFVPADRPRAQMRELMANGWTVAMMAEELAPGTSSKQFFEITSGISSTIRAEMAEKIAALYVKLRLGRGPSKHTRTRARRVGWCPTPPTPLDADRFAFIDRVREIEGLSEKQALDKYEWELRFFYGGEGKWLGSSTDLSALRRAVDAGRGFS